MEANAAMRLYSATSKNGSDTRFKNAELPANQINVLRQPRVTFEEIEELAQNIEEWGLFHPLTVVKFKTKSCKQYLQVVNKLWGTDYTLRNLKPAAGSNGTASYYILIAGERRYRAITSHPKTIKQLLRVNLGIDLDPFDALFIQFSENTHKAVPPHEEAEGFYNLYKLLMEKEPAQWTKAKFARIVGKREEWMYDALRFCELPESVRKNVEDNIIPYGMAVQLTRLQKAGYEEQDLLRIMSIGVAEAHNVDEFRKMVSKLLEEKRGQMALFAIDVEAIQRQGRRAVAKDLVMALWRMKSYWETLFKIVEQGHLGSIFSPNSPTRALHAFTQLNQDLVALEEALLPEMEKYLTRKQREEIQTAIEQTKNLMEVA